MGTRLISAGVGIVIALVVLFLHNTVVLKIAIAAINIKYKLIFFFIKMNTPYSIK